jgi:hypothetical protein
MGLLKRAAIFVGKLALEEITSTVFSEVGTSIGKRLGSYIYQEPKQDNKEESEGKSKDGKEQETKDSDGKEDDS